MNKRIAFMFIFLIAIVIIFAVFYPYFGIQINSQSAGFQIILEAISVLFFGGIMAYILESQKRRYEQSQQIQTSNLARLRYLRGIKTEIEAISKPFEVFTILADKKKAEEILDRGEEFQDVSESFRSIQDISRTTYWDALVPSGLLPSVVSPEVLSKISDFYHLLRVLIRMLDDIEQYDIESNRSGNNSKLTYMFKELHKEEYFKKKLLPTITELATSGKDVLGELNVEIKTLEMILDIVPNPIDSSFDENSDVPGNRGLEFTDIFLENLNEFLTQKKSQDNAEGGENIYEFTLRLSKKPPEDWGDTIEYGNKKSGRSTYWRSEEGHQEAIIKGRYLILKCTKSQLKNNLARLILSIRKKNEEYRNNIKV